MNCENCGSPIGKLEPPRKWERKSVCLACHQKLLNGTDWIDAIRAHWREPKMWATVALMLMIFVAVLAWMYVGIYR